MSKILEREERDGESDAGVLHSKSLEMNSFNTVVRVVLIGLPMAIESLTLFYIHGSTSSRLKLVCLLPILWKILCQPIKQYRELTMNYATPKESLLFNGRQEPGILTRLSDSGAISKIR